MQDSDRKEASRFSKDIFPTEAWELISKDKENGDLVIIDVSTPKEYRELHLEGAINVSLFSRLFKTRLDAMDRNKTYIVYCKVGGRSKIAQKLMQQVGFRATYNIVGGTLLWEEEGLPFASGTEGTNSFSLCPFFVSIVLIKKTKKLLRTAFTRIDQHTRLAGFSR